jgi:hypothetical protein
MAPKTGLAASAKAMSLSSITWLTSKLPKKQQLPRHFK